MWYITNDLRKEHLYHQHPLLLCQKTQIVTRTRSYFIIAEFVKLGVWLKALNVFIPEIFSARSLSFSYRTNCLYVLKFKHSSAIGYEMFRAGPTSHDTMGRHHFRDRTRYSWEMISYRRSQLSHLKFWKLYHRKKRIYQLVSRFADKPQNTETPTVFTKSITYLHNSGGTLVYTGSCIQHSSPRTILINISSVGHVNW